jgi:gas vesicle protein
MSSITNNIGLTIVTPIYTNYRQKGENEMVNENQIPEYHDNTILGILAGLLIGSLAGAITMLLLAPQSGADTRMQILEKGIELRDRTNVMMGDAVAQVRLDRNKITMGSRRKAQELLHHGQTLVVKQLDHVSEAAQAGKKAIQNS